jgi:hypothetical protein
MFLAAALGDAVLGHLSLTDRVAHFRHLRELGNGRRARQLEDFIERHRVSTARRIGVMHDQPWDG